MEMLFDIMDIPKIVEDEDIVGWFGSIASANGWDGRSFMSAFFPENIACRNGIFSAVRDYRGIYERYGRFGFPDPGKMLMSHSPVPVSGLFMPDFYIGMLADMTLNGTDMLPFESARYRAPMYCPLCLKEDLAKEGRAVVHIPHQVPGVTACYKHCVRLSKDPDARPERAEEQEFRTAKAVQMLYRKQAVGSFEDIAGPLRKRAEERGKLSLLNRSDSFPFYKNALSLSASLFTDGEILRAYDKDDGWAIKSSNIIKKDSPGSCSFSREFPFITFTCGKCRTRVTQYAMTALAGGMCPACSSRTKWQERMPRMARHCIDPAFRVVRFRGDKKADIRHIACGRVIEGCPLRYVFRKKINCPLCRDDRNKANIGVRKRMDCGLMAEITAYSSSTHIDVEFEDGSKRTGAGYGDFMKGRITPENFSQDRYVGQKKVMDSGLEGEIIRFGSPSDIDVLFADGTVARGAAYKSFCRGRTDSEYKERVMNNGLKARVIAVHSYSNVDIMFENGEIRTGISFYQFRTGNVRSELYEQGRRDSHIGEVHIQNCGLSAEIMEFKKATDVKVRFENGEIREGVAYGQLKKGIVLPPSKQRKKKRI